MKTAISIPDPIFEQAEHFAHKQGMSRSEFYTKAIAEYIKERDEENITENLNRIYENTPSSVEKEINSIQYYSLNNNQEKW